MEVKFLLVVSKSHFYRGMKLAGGSDKYFFTREMMKHRDKLFDTYDRLVAKSTQ